jgi:TolB-like protein
MTGGSADRVESLFHRLLALRSEDRPAELEAVAARDAALAAEVATLLAAHAATGAVERLAGAIAPTVGRIGATAHDHSGHMVGRFRVGARVGQGGMGVVHRARDTQLEREVALKFLPPWLGADPGARERFLQEARAASALDHPNVCTLHEIGTTSDGELFLAMPLYQGETLRERVERGPLPVSAALGLLREVASGLAAAHARGIVHRDVKPSNILLTHDGGVKLLDFGIAKLAGSTLTRTGELVGTLRYMAPEQLGGGAVDARADVYALGMVLHEMLTGEVLLPGRAVAASLAGAPAPLRELVARMLHVEPDERPADAAAVLGELEALAVATARAPAASRRRVLLSVGGAAVAALLAFLALSRGAGGTIPDGAAPGPAQHASVAVLPFRTSGVDAAQWGEGLVELLSANLEGAGNLRRLDPGGVLGAWRRDFERLETPSASQGRALARRLGASFAVTGSLVRAGASVRLAAEVLDTRDGRVLATARADGTADSILALVDDLTMQLLRSGALPVDDTVSVGALQRLNTASVEALKAYLAGERAYRRARFAEAAREFQRAVDLDSTFGRAYVRLAFAANWTNNLSLARRSFEQAARLGDRLSPRERLLVRQQGRLEALDTLTRRYPDDADGWAALGDYLFHFGGLTFQPDVAFRSALERAVALAPHYGESYAHLLEEAFIRRDSSRVARLLSRLASVEAAGLTCPGEHVVQRLVWGTPGERAEAERAVERMAYDDLNCAWVSLAVAAPAVAVSERADLARLTGSSHPNLKIGSIWRSLQARAMRGESRAAHRMLAQAARELTLDPLLARWPARFAVMAAVAGYGDTSLWPGALATLRSEPEGEDDLWLGLVADRAGRLGAAQRTVQVLTARAAREGDSATATRYRAYATTLDAYLGLRRGDWSRLPAFEAALRHMPTYSFLYGQAGQHLRFAVGRMLLERGDSTGALRYFRSFYHYDWASFVPLQFHLGQLFEARGDAVEARARYGLVVAWWADADPELQPLVQEARERLAALGAS